MGSGADKKQPEIELLKMRLTAEDKYERIQTLQGVINYENQIRRNVRCVCGSGKKWKKCCLPVHEKNTKILEKMVKEYRDMCVEIRNINRRKGK
jgi:hypothetical protein|tara:strand:+ start:1164 stop:1445 length:282 start_codon:yes stop_codon:yes gene_type:complete